jgi:hypothetical protein
MSFLAQSHSDGCHKGQSWHYDSGMGHGQRYVVNGPPFSFHNSVANETAH